MSTTTTKPADRAASIADFIFNTASQAITTKVKAGEISQELQDASAEAGNQRELLMHAIAATAHRDAWSVKEINSATALAAAKFNDKKSPSAKAFSTMVGEIKKAADEKVRGVFPHLVNLRDTVWSAEDSAVKAAKKAEMHVDAPCRLAFARSYHMLVALMSETQEEGPQRFTTAVDVIEFAQSRDPRRDPDKVGKMVDKLCATLEEFHRNFPTDMTKTTLEFLRSFTPEELMKQRDEYLAQRQAAEARQRAEEDGLLGDGGDNVSDAAPNDAAAQPSAPIPTIEDDIEALLAA